MSTSTSESKYLVTSSPSEAVSASIPLIHSRSCIWTRKVGGGGTIEAGLTSVILLHDIVAMYHVFVASIQYYAQIFAKKLLSEMHNLCVST